MEYKINDTFAINAFFSDGAGAPTDPTGDAVYTVYKDNVIIAALTGSLAKINAVTGYFGATIALTAANGFAVGSDYATLITATVDGHTVTTLRRFRITANDLTAADVVTAMLASGGVTNGGTWTLAKMLKIWAAFFTGSKKLKTGETNVYQFIDPDDGVTVVLEMTQTTASPYFTFSVKI